MQPAHNWQFINDCISFEFLPIINIHSETHVFNNHPSFLMHFFVSGFLFVAGGAWFKSTAIAGNLMRTLETQTRLFQNTPKFENVDLMQTFPALMNTAGL